MWRHTPYLKLSVLRMISASETDPVGVSPQRKTTVCVAEQYVCRRGVGRSMDGAIDVYYIQGQSTSPG